MDNNVVRVKLFPYSEYELVPREAASHLFRLLQRYNWTLENPERYRERWAAFWPSIGPVQRQILSLFVMTNCGGILGRRLDALDPPIEFEPLVGMWDAIVCSPEVERELRRLLTSYFSHLVESLEVLARWERDCSAELAEQSGQSLVALLFSAGVGLHADLFIAQAAEAMSRDLAESERVARATQLAAAVTRLMGEKEQELWAAC